MVQVFLPSKPAPAGIQRLETRDSRLETLFLSAIHIFTGYLKVQGEKDMGYQLNEETFQKVFDAWSRDYDLYAPKLYAGTGRFSETDVVRYGVIKSPEDIV